MLNKVRAGAEYLPNLGRGFQSEGMAKSKALLTCSEARKEVTMGGVKAQRE